VRAWVPPSTEVDTFAAFRPQLFITGNAPTLPTSSLQLLATPYKSSALLRQQASKMRFAIGATYALAAAVVRADDASAAEAESSTSTTVAKPTFTVRS
jgi:hypothetical protein